MPGTRAETANSQSQNGKVTLGKHIRTKFFMNLKTFSEFQFYNFRDL